MLKSMRAKYLQDIYHWYFVTSGLQFGKDTAQSSTSPSALVIVVKYVCKSQKSSSFNKAVSIQP